MLRYQHYIEDLNKITKLLNEREKQRFDDRHVDFLLVEAAELSCKALNNILIEDTFWSWVNNKEKNSSNIEISSSDFEQIVLPVNSQLLKKLNYVGPPSAEELIIDTKNVIENAKYDKDKTTDIRTKIENLTSFICSNAGRAKGILGAYDAGVNSVLREEKKEPGFFSKLQKKIPVKKMITGIKDTVTIITGVITIAEHIHGEQPTPPPPPVDKDKIERVAEPPQPVNQPNTIPIDDFWLKYYKGLGNNPDRDFPSGDEPLE
jgi:hypothetical protein